MRAVFVLVKTDPGHMTEVANRIGEIESFSEAYSTSGEYDLLVKLYVDDIDSLGRVIERDVHAIPHVRSTFTILTFEAFGARRYAELSDLGVDLSLHRTERSRRESNPRSTMRRDSAEVSLRM